MRWQVDQGMWACQGAQLLWCCVQESFEKASDAISQIFKVGLPCKYF